MGFEPVFGFWSLENRQYTHILPTSLCNPLWRRILTQSTSKVTKIPAYDGRLRSDNPLLVAYPGNPRPPTVPEGYLSRWWWSWRRLDPVHAVLRSRTHHHTRILARYANPGLPWQKSGRIRWNNSTIRFVGLIWKFGKLLRIFESCLGFEIPQTNEAELPASPSIYSL